MNVKILFLLITSHVISIIAMTDVDIFNLLDYSNIEQHRFIRPTVNTFKPSLHKELIYIAVEHVTDLNHPTMRMISSIIEDKQIEFAVFEGFNYLEGESPPWISSLVKEYLQHHVCPENVYGGHICIQNNIPFIGGDAPNHTHLEPLSEKGFSEKDLVFFMLAQNFPIWNRDKMVNKENFATLAEDMIQKNITYWLKKDTLPYTVEEFLKWHKAHTGKEFDIARDFPWGVDRKEFMPNLANDASIYQKIQAHILPIRDMQCIRIIKESLEKYNKILVVFGASHFIWQRAALEKLFGSLSSRVDILSDANN